MPSQVKRVGLEGSKPWLVSASATGVVARSAPTYTGRGNCKSCNAQHMAGRVSQTKYSIWGFLCSENFGITHSSATPASTSPALPISLWNSGNEDKEQHTEQHLLPIWDDCVNQVNLLLRHLGQVHLEELHAQSYACHKGPHGCARAFQEPAFDEPQTTSSTLMLTRNRAVTVVRVM